MSGPNKLVVGEFSFSSSSSSQLEASLLPSSVLKWSASLFYRLMRGKNMSSMKCQFIFLKMQAFLVLPRNICYSWWMFEFYYSSLNVMGIVYTQEIVI